MSTFSLKLNEIQISKLINTFQSEIKPNSNEYIRYFIQNDNVTITIYTSNKVVFQGEDAFFYAQSFLENKLLRHGGSDEVGTGDYFGPICVCASIVEESDIDILNKYQITDSKQMSDEKILQIGKEICEHFNHSLLILDNQKYNEVHKTNNMNAIKAKMHNQAYLNLINKGNPMPKMSYVDQFCEETLYYDYLKNEKTIYKNLIFETKAEVKYQAVAVSSVIARYAFLKYMNNLNNQYNFNFPKGAGDIVDEKALEFVKKYGLDELNKVAKIHFKNTENIRNNI